MRDNLTDDEIVAGYLAHRLGTIIPDYADINAVAGYRLSPKRAERISGKIIEILEGMRRPLLRSLNERGAKELDNV
jgi:hypothetical protein